MAVAFMRAYRKSLDFVINSPASDIARLEYEAGFFPGIDIDVLEKMIQAYKRLGCWESDPTISKALYDKLLEVFLSGGVISQRYPYEKVIVQPPATR